MLKETLCVFVSPNGNVIIHKYCQVVSSQGLIGVNPHELCFYSQNSKSCVFFFLVCKCRRGFWIRIKQRGQTFERIILFVMRSVWGIFFIVKLLHQISGGPALGYGYTHKVCSVLTGRAATLKKVILTPSKCYLH